MKINKIFVFAAFLLLVISCAGIKTVKGYQTLAALSATETAAFNSYLRLVVSGQLKTNDLPEVSMAYDAFQLAMRTAIINAGNNSNVVATVDVQNIANSFSTKVANAQQRK